MGTDADDPRDEELPAASDAGPSDAAEGQEARAPAGAGNGNGTAEAEDYPDEADVRTGLPPKMEAWRKRSATGAILTGIALGFQQVFEPERHDAAIIQESSGDPPEDLPVEAHVEQLRPRHSVVSIRPWLLRDKDRDAVDRDPPDEKP